MVNRTNYCPTVIVLPACLYCHFSGNSLFFFQGEKNYDMPPLNLALDVTPSNFCAESYFFARFNWPPAKVWQKKITNPVSQTFDVSLPPFRAFWRQTQTHIFIFIYELLHNHYKGSTVTQNKYISQNVFQSNIQIWLDWPSQEKLWLQLFDFLFRHGLQLW